MKRAALIAAGLGATFPLLLYSAMQWTPMLDEVPEQMILWMWPTYFFLLGFAGPVNSTVILAVAISAAFNGAIYALIAAFVIVMVRRLRGMPSNHQMERDA